MTRTSPLGSLAPLFQIGWRNLWRQKRRSLVVIMSIGIGISAMVMVTGFTNGMTTQMVDNTINTLLGHLTMERKEFRNSIKLEYSFEPGPDLYAALNRERSLIAYAPRVVIKGMIRSSEASRGVLIKGIDPAREKRVSKLYDYMVKDGGRYLSGPSADEILISRSLADKLDVQLDDRVVLMFQDRNNEIVGAGLRVAGFFESPMGNFDKGVVFVGIARLQELAGLGNALSQITMITADKDGVDAVKSRLSPAVRPPLEVLTWKEMAPNLVSAIQLQETMMFIIFLIVFITVLFSIANTLIMSIIERFHELGVMKSIGTRPSHVFLMVMFEAINLGILGLAAGLLISIPVVLILGHTGIDFSFAMTSMRKWGIGNSIYPVITPWNIASAATIVFITTVAAALYPALKAARIKPLDALNYI